MSTYLVTGAAGFIGAAVARRLVEHGHNVVTIDNLSTGYRANVPAAVEFYQADCQDPEVYRQLPRQRYAAIIHTAGQSSGEISFDDPVYDLRTNTEATLRLLKFALANGCDRLLYASSMSVYGPKPDRPVAEDESASPASFYGVGKLASEHYLRIYETYGVSSTSLRLFNVYGPGQNMANPRQGMVSIFVAQMLKNRHIHIKGSGQRYRDFIYIDDVVDAFLSCLSHVESSGMVLNFGTGVRTCVSDLVDTLVELYQKEVTTEYAGSTAGDIHGIYADIGLARRVVSWEPGIHLHEGLTRTLQWCRSLRRC